MKKNTKILLTSFVICMLLDITILIFQSFSFIHVGDSFELNLILLVIQFALLMILCLNIYYDRAMEEYNDAKKAKGMIRNIICLTTFMSILFIIFDEFF